MTPFHRSITDADGMACTVGISPYDGRIELDSCGNIALTPEQSKLLRCALEAAERAVPIAIGPDDGVDGTGEYPTVTLRDRDGDKAELRKSRVGERCLSLKAVSPGGVLVFTPEQVRELRRIIKPFEAPEKALAA